MQKYNKLSQMEIESRYNISKFCYKSIIFVIFFSILIYICFTHKIYLNQYKKTYNDKKLSNHLNKLIDDNFFVIDSNNLENAKSHMYGYCISTKGVLTDNYYKLLGEYREPEPLGVYVMIRKNRNEIIINQDCYGSFGIYIFEDKNKNYFAISNSFLLLEEYLIGKHNLSLNKDYADNFIITDLCTFSIGETLINEINKIPSNGILLIDIKNKIYKVKYIDYQENTIRLESEEGLKIIDNWIYKWGYIFRSLKYQTDYISADLSGGFDSRATLSILLNSGINLNNIMINSIKDKKHDHEVDFEIATKISSKYGFKLNNFNFDNNASTWSLKDTLLNSMYSKLGFHKQFYFKTKFYNKPRFTFSGSGGESLRGVPFVSINEYINRISSNTIFEHQEEFYNSSKRLLNRTLYFLKNDKIYENDYDISLSMYSKAVGANHFGKAALESFISNYYYLQPLLDPEIKKIKYIINKNCSQDLIAYIYVRFAHDLIYFPFQGNRTLNFESIKKAENLNNKMGVFKANSSFNKNFYIDNKRMIPSLKSKHYIDPSEYLKKVFKSSEYIKIINKIYDNNVYNWANEYIKKTDYFPLSQHYALLAIAITRDNLFISI
jgi:hypothetical protein